MDKLNFSDKKYLEILKRIEDQNGNGDKCEFTSKEAFLYLIKGLAKEDLENLCKQIQQHFSFQYKLQDLSIDECYEILQGNEIRGIQLDERVKSEILEQAYKVIDSGKFLGNKTIMDGKINTSSWLSHSMYVARFSEIIARELRDKQNMDLDTDAIKALALLHDYGRKFDHTMGHVTKGAEALIDDGCPHAAVATVMHSFFLGKRCANNEEAVPGFYMDEEGRECWKEDSQMDDMREYLDIHRLSIGDMILNLGDLVATDKGVVKLSDRLDDIATRRKLDPTNREFFLLQVINGMIYILNKMKVEISDNIMQNLPKIGDRLEKTEETISELSDVLYNYYKERTQQKEMK